MTDTLTTEKLDDAIRSRPRMHLADLPTPLDEAPHLSERLGVRILVKRDDLTGLALGGNKVRKLEFLIADAKSRGADTIITTGGSQSNHARLTAAACRRADLACYLVLDRGVHPEQQGNLLLDELFGAYVQFVETADPAEATAGMEALASALEAEGRTPYIIPRGGSIPQGATGYAAMIPELTGQLQEMGIASCYLYLGTGSTGTHSGVLAGATALDSPITVQGISVSRDQEQQEAKILTLTNETLDYLGLKARVQPGAIRVDDSYRGPGYGIPTPETMEAVGIAALDEGLLLDPVYTGKAMAGLIGHARSGAFQSSDTVVFLHTGGAPALFAYHQEIADSLALTQA